MSFVHWWRYTWAKLSGKEHFRVVYGPIANEENTSRLLTYDEAVGLAHTFDGWVQYDPPQHGDRNA